MIRISVGARKSPLSKAQCHEVLQELRAFHPKITFDCVWMDTSGDKDHQTSLRYLGKTDFFTKEIDTLVLNGKCRVAIHSAKDLPEPLPKGLKLVALTRGLDSCDSLVMRQGDSIQSLHSKAIIATSSLRREEIVRKLRPDFCFKDIRGTIEERLAKLKSREVDGVVIAEAALIRLKFTHLNRFRLPEDTAQYQGQLAVVACEKDYEMQALFSCIDSRKNLTFYTGLEVPEKYKECIHYPLIKIIPRQVKIPDINPYTHILFTSKTSVKLFFDQCKENLQNKKFITVGIATAEELQKQGITPFLIAKEESSEGIVKELETLSLKNAFLFYPHSALARHVISDYLNSKLIKYDTCVLYDTVVNTPMIVPNLSGVKEVIFTSPSTVNAFCQIFGKLPEDKILISIGPVTAEYLRNRQNLSHTYF